MGSPLMHDPGSQRVRGRMKAFREKYHSRKKYYRQLVLYRNDSRLNFRLWVKWKTYWFSSGACFRLGSFICIRQKCWKMNGSKVSEVPWNLIYRLVILILSVEEGRIIQLLSVCKEKLTENSAKVVKFGFIRFREIK